MLRSAAFFVVLSGFVQSGHAQGLGLPALTDRFATCVGRFAAMMEHQWMNDDAQSPETADRLETMRELLETVTPPNMRGWVMARENEARLAFERLLDRSDDDGGAWARARIDAQLGACTDLLLD